MRRRVLSELFDEPYFVWALVDKLLVPTAGGYYQAGRATRHWSAHSPGDSYDATVLLMTVVDALRSVSVTMCDRAAPGSASATSLQRPGMERVCRHVTLHLKPEALPPERRFRCIPTRMQVAGDALGRSPGLAGRLWAVGTVVKESAAPLRWPGQGAATAAVSEVAMSVEAEDRRVFQCRAYGTMMRCGILIRKEGDGGTGGGDPELDLHFLASLAYVEFGTARHWARVQSDWVEGTSEGATWASRESTKASESPRGS